MSGPDRYDVGKRSRADDLKAGRRSPRRLDAHRNRELILDGAIATLRDNYASTFEQIIADSALARTTVYRHFPTYAALIDALIDRLLSAVRDLLEQARPEEPPFDEAFGRMTSTAIAAGTDMWDLLSLANSGTLTSSPPVARIDAAVRALMQLGVDEGRLRDDVPLDFQVETYFALLAAAVEQRERDPSIGWRVVHDVFLDGLSVK